MELIDFQHAPIASIIFLITVVTSIAAFTNAQLMEQFLLHPYAIFRGHKQPTVLTSGFIHADWMHLLFNMIAYTSFAYALEREDFLGHWRFVLVYLGSLLLSNMATAQLHKDEPQYRALGASGAVSGIVLSAILFVPDLRMAFFFIPMRGWQFAILYLGLSYYAARKRWGNVGHDAHLYGALSGIALTLLLKPSVIHTVKAWFLHMIQ